MTTNTTACNTGVIKRRRNPAIGCMAVVAIVSARNMRRILAGGDRTVMAGRARADYVGMIYPISGRK